MDFDRRGVLRGAASAVGMAMLPGRLVAAPGDPATFGMIQISASGMTVAVYQLDMETFRRSAGTSGYERLAPKKVGEAYSVLASPLRPDVADSAAAADTVDIVVQNIEKLKTRYGVADANIGVVASSGVASYSGPLIAQLSRTLKARTGHELDVVTPREEARMAFDWIVPAGRRGRMLQFDIGSGNSKGGYYDRSGHPKLYHDISVPFGTKTLAGAVKTRWPDVRTGDFGARASEFYDDTIAPLIRPQLDAAQEAMLRPDICMTGGIVWATAMIVRPQEMAARRDWLPMSGADFTTLRKLVEAGEPYGSGLPETLTADQKAWVLKTLGVVRNTFNPHQLAAGAAIGEGLARQLAFDRRKDITFAAFANNSWSSQYLIEKFGSGRPGKKAA